MAGRGWLLENQPLNFIIAPNRNEVLKAESRSHLTENSIQKNPKQQQKKPKHTPPFFYKNGSHFVPSLKV